MKKKIINLLILVFLICLFFLIVLKYTPVGSSFLYSKGKSLYEAQNFKDAMETFEEGLKIHPEDETMRYYYVLTLSKVEPTYSVQEKLYKFANSNIKDNAQKIAKSQVILLKNKLTEDFEGSYILHAISGKDVIHWNLEDFPIKVYVDHPSDVPKYYIDNIELSISEWEDKTGFLSFKLVEDEKDSNISILFNDHKRSDCTEDKCQYVVATTEHSIKSDNTLEKMTISFFKTNPYGEEFSDKEIHHTALHEMGHALGIMGHSEETNDIMYADTNRLYDSFDAYRPESLYITLKDLKTIALLYKIYPNVTNSKITNKEKYIYAPIVLGNDDELLKHKLEEYLQYIEKYPQICGGYINIATVYADMGENSKALEMLETAQNLASNNDEIFLIHFNRAMIYYNMQDIVKSKDSAISALKIKDDNNLRELLEVLDKMNK